MPAQAALLTRAERRWATAALMLATAMQAADATIINVALPQLERDLGGGLWLGAWVMTSYLCAAAIVAPMTGWLRRRFGPAPLYVTATALFVGASLLCALAPSAAAIIVFRTLQGAGGGVLPALSQAFLHDLHPRERHGQILGIWGAVAMIGPILGPALGGVITDFASWRWVFALNLPLGIVALWRMRELLPTVEEHADVPFDLVGLLLLIAGVGALQLCLARGVGRNWLQSPEVLAEAAVALVALAATVLRSRHSRRTILRLDVFRDINFAAATFFNFWTSAVVFVALVFFLPTLVQGPLGYSATIGGLTIVPRGVIMMLTVLAAGQVIGKVDYRIMLAVGSMLVVAGLALLAATANSIPWIILGSVIQAIGAGAILMPLSTYAFSTLPIERRTDAAGLYSLLRQIGCASGVALMSAVLHELAAANLVRLTAGGGPATAQLVEAATFQAYCQSFLLMAVASLILLPGVLLFRVERLGAGAKAQP